MNHVTKGMKTFRAFNYFFLTFVGLMLLYPFVRTLLASITPGSELIFTEQRLIYIPSRIAMDAYQKIFENSVVPQAYKISFTVTIVGTLLSILATMLTAYPLSVKEQLPGKRVMMFLIVFTMLFDGGLIPLYMVVRSLGLIDSLFSLILPILINSFYIIVMRNYFTSIPYSLHESAKIDGCNDLVILFRIVAPLSKPMLLTIALFYCVGYWNSFFNVIMFINDSALYTLPVLLRMILLQSQSTNVLNVVGDSKALSTGIRAAIVVATALPILTVYPMIQKHFIQGMSLGAVKE